MGGASDPLTSAVLLRDVAERDLSILFEQQLDPVANHMAAFPAREREAFMAHWAKILGDDTVIKKTILCGDQVAGYVVCFGPSGRRLVGYWVGRRYWGKGIATGALAEFLARVGERPLHAHVASHNVGSLRVLKKCGFTLSGESSVTASEGGDAVDELVFTLAE